MGKTIMVVADSAAVRQVVGIALRGAGYEVLEGVDGKDALGKLTGQKVHLIISDVNMPNMDGITFVKDVKKLPAYKFRPRGRRPGWSSRSSPPRCWPPSRS